MIYFSMLAYNDEMGIGARLRNIARLILGRNHSWGVMVGT